MYRIEAYTTDGDPIAVLILDEHVHQLFAREAHKFAHELAEKIRAAVPTGITMGGPHTDGQMFAANLIDPEVTG